MEKYLIILIIIMVLYYIEKYCIQSEVDKILITKNIIEKFTENTITNSILYNITSNLQDTNRLDISGNIIINNRHKLTSDGNYLKITDISGQNFLNMSVKNLDVSGQLLVRQNSTFLQGTHRFINPNNNSLLIDTSGNNAGIKSLTGPLNIDASVNKIIFSGNTDILGNLTINNLKPILIKTFTTNGTNINTGISHSIYSGIGFSGYDQSSNTTFEFNTYKQNGNWFISFIPKTNSNTLSPIKIRLIFFSTFFHIDEQYIIAPLVKNGFYGKIIFNNILKDSYAEGGRYFTYTLYRDDTNSKLIGPVLVNPDSSSEYIISETDRLPNSQTRLKVAIEFQEYYWLEDDFSIVGAIDPTTNGMPNMNSLPLEFYLKANVNNLESGVITLNLPISNDYESDSDSD